MRRCDQLVDARPIDIDDPEAPQTMAKCRSATIRRRRDMRLFLDVCHDRLQDVAFADKALGRPEKRPPLAGRAPVVVTSRGYSSQQGLASSQQGPPSQQSAAWAAAPKANSRTKVESIVRNILFSVD